MDNRLWLRDLCVKNNLFVSDAQLSKLEDFVVHLSEWNQKINLISRTDIENIWTKHILGSISFLFRFSIDGAASVVDVGTGGGFPGIPLAILFPNAKLTLIDSIKKKIMVVEDIIKQLHLSNAEAVNGRAEEISAKGKHNKAYDYVVARAVAPTADMIKWCTPFLRTENLRRQQSPTSSAKTEYIPRGSMIFLKGGNLVHEIDQAKIKSNPKSIDDYPIIIDGIDPTELSDKRVVVIQP